MLKDKDHLEFKFIESESVSNITRCPLDEMGRNSVIPCIMPIIMSFIFYLILAKCQPLHFMQL